MLYTFFWSKCLETIGGDFSYSHEKRLLTELIKIYCTISNIGLILVELKLYLSHFIFFSLLSYLFTSALIFDQYILTSAYTNLKPQSWQPSFIFILRLSEYLILFRHEVYLLTKPSCSISKILAIYERMFAILNTFLVTCHYLNNLILVNSNQMKSDSNNGLLFTSSANDYFVLFYFIFFLVIRHDFNYLYI